MAKKKEAEKPPLRSFTLAATGDFLTHEAVLASGLQQGGGTYDFTKMLAPIKGIISSADLAICHQEIPMNRTNENITAYPVFNAPRQMADLDGEQAPRSAQVDAAHVTTDPIAVERRGHDDERWPRLGQQQTEE